MRRAVAVAAALVAAGVAYLALWPVPVEPVAWVAPPAMDYTGAHTANTRLAGLRTIDLGGDEGPEHVAIGPDGALYAAVAGGRILRMRPDGSERVVFADTGGRVLGFAWDAAGRLIAADAMRGLMAIDGTGRATVLADRVQGDPIRYADAVAVARDGRIYLSDASARFAPRDWGGTFEASVLDIVEQRATGRILEHDPARGTTRIVAHGLSFANGVALSADERSLFVVETGRYRVWRVPVDADALDLRSGDPRARLVFDNLPGYPDNLMRGADGRLWLGFTKPRNPVVDGMAGKPWLRAVTLRLPRVWWPVPPSYGHVIAFDESGRVLADLQDPSGAYPETTGVTETTERLYVQSLHAKALGWLPNPLSAAAR